VGKLPSKAEEKSRDGQKGKWIAERTPDDEPSQLTIRKGKKIRAGKKKKEVLSNMISILGVPKDSKKSVKKPKHNGGKGKPGKKKAVTFFAERISGGTRNSVR